MSIQQEKVEKSVQTHDSSTNNLTLLTNHPENAAAEVANTLVSMATGQQRTNLQDLNVITMTQHSSSGILPVSSVGQYTMTNCIPSTFDLDPQQQITITQCGNENDMSTDEYHSASNQSSDTSKPRQTKRSKTQSSGKSLKETGSEVIQYGPISVKPRKRIAPTLANGRRSKDEPLPPDEDLKRKQRRDRNKHAAAKCRRKRNELREQLEHNEKLLVEQQQHLEKTVQSLNDRKNQLECLLQRHMCTRKTVVPISTNSTHQFIKPDLKTIPQTTNILDTGSNTINTKRITINFSNAQDFLAVAPVTRVTGSNDNSTPGLSLITIHILPDGNSQTLFSSAIDRSKIVELLQHASSNNSNAQTAVMINNMSTDSIVSTNTSTNSTS